MKTKGYLFILGLFLSTPLFAQLPTASEIADKMTVGWNIGNSLEVPQGGETGWGNPKINQNLIDAVKEAGFNTIRIPCAWNSHANQSTFEIDANFLDRVAEVVEYCYANDMYVILNCHWDGGWLENNVTEAKKDEVNAKQRAYWTQIAEYFNDYDEHLLFASANEPNVDNGTQMPILISYHQSFIDAVRSTGGNNSSRTLVVQGPSTDIVKTKNLMTTMPVDSIDNRLMAEVHYYTPWNFCGMTQDESWGKMFYFWGKDNHSTTNTNRNPTWGEEAEVEKNFNYMKTKFSDAGIPVILGEYSVVNRKALTGEDLTLHIKSREYFLKYVTDAAKRYGMVPIYWDNGSQANNNCAIFDRLTGEIVDHGAVDAIIEGSTTSTPVEEEKETGTSSGVNYLNVLPNPVTSSTNIQVSLKDPAQVNLSIFNILGEEVAAFNDLNYNPGIHNVKWDAGHLAAGIYFVNLSVGSQSFIKKFLLVR